PRATASQLDAEEIRISDALRRLRADQGLSLRDVARLSGMSESYLSRVERHQAALTIPGLRRLADAFGVPMASFFAEAAHRMPLAICRAGRGRRGRIRGAHGFLYEMLAADKAGKVMEPLIVDLATAARSLTPESHPGEEFNYVLEGECTFAYGKERTLLARGDAVYYDATVPHVSQAVKGTTCLMLVVVASRDYALHGDIHRLLRKSGAAEKP
ncbi:MAG TPA: XRE family transcriptional regulator, partial [Planctomycetota bacterium]|nr:XRE family transcriptional regulator [Planctomycetota bacterium]